MFLGNWAPAYAGATSIRGGDIDTRGDVDCRVACIMGHPVVEGRLYYATTDGGFRDARIPLTLVARRVGVEVLEIVDRAVETGFLAAAPAEKACSWCDFRPVCGPNAQRRITRIKVQDPLADLLALRRKP